MTMQFDALNTGNSGVQQTFGNEETSTEQDEAISEQQREVQELLPSVQQILNAIDEEIEAIGDIRSYMKTLPEAPELKDVEAEYRGRELFIGMAERLKTAIANKVADVMEVNQ